MVVSRQDWSKSWLTEPQDNIISHELLPKMRRFKPSYETNHCPVYMKLLLAWEYARIWQKEHNEFVKQCAQQEKTRFIKNNYQTWVEKRKLKSKKMCLKKKTLSGVGNKK